MNLQFTLQRYALQLKINRARSVELSACFRRSWKHFCPLMKLKDRVRA